MVLSIEEERNWVELQRTPTKVDEDEDEEEEEDEDEDEEMVRFC